MIEIPPDEAAALDAIAADLAEATRDPSTPPVLLSAFSAEPVRCGPWELPWLTMGGWLALERSKSPFVSGCYPSDPSDRLEAITDALRVLTGEPVTAAALQQLFSPAEMLQVESIISQRIDDSFGTALPMRLPNKQGAEDRQDHGFGWWIIIYTALCLYFGESRSSALKCPLPQAFALIATRDLLQGAVPSGLNYKERGVNL